MRLSRGRSLGLAAARALAYNGDIAGAHADPYFGGIGCFMIGARDSAPHAAACERLPVPGIVAKDAVGLGDDVPTFDIVEISTIGLADLDMPQLKFCSELADLRIGKRRQSWARA
jgi:hypothetical protein